MTKTELITAVAVKADLSQAAAQRAVDAVVETIMDTIRDGDKVTVPGFGTFLLVERPARMARNPRTGEILPLPVRKLPRFVPGSRFREAAK